MPRYFFDIDNHERYVDDEGTELESEDDARVQAVIFAGDYLRENPDLVCNGQHMSVAVRDQTDTILLRVTVATNDPSRAER